MFLKATNNNAHHDCGALYSNVGEIIPDSKVEEGEGTIITEGTFNYQQKINLKNYTVDSSLAKKDSLYLKISFNHHGHILTNIIPSIHYWIDPKYKNTTKIYVTYGKDTHWWAQDKVPCVIEELKKAINYTKDDIIVHKDKDVLIESKFTTPPEMLNCVLKKTAGSKDKWLHVKNKIIEQNNQESPIKNKKLYLARDPNINRVTPELEEQTRGFLLSQGFKFVLMRKYSFSQQVSIMQNADIVAGYSGSQLHNSMFCKKGTLCINLGDHKRDGDTPFEFAQSKDIYKYLQRDFCDIQNRNYFIPTKNKTWANIEKELHRIIA